MSWIDDYNNRPDVGQITPPQQKKQQAQQPPKQQKQQTGGLIGQLAHSIADPFVTLGKGLAYTPKAIYREVQNKPIDDIQQKVFGTNDSGQIGKKIVGSTLGAAATVAVPEAKAGILARVAQGAKIGAAGGAGGALSENGNLDDVLTGAVGGGLTGGAIGGGAGILSSLKGGVKRVAANRVATTTEKQANAKQVELESAFKNVPKTVRQNSDLQGTMQHLQNLGIEPTKENMRTFANLVTGDNGIVSGTVRQLLGNVDRVGTHGVMDDVKNALLKEAGQLGNVEERSTAANGVMRSIRNDIQGIAMHGKGSLDEAADANDALDTVRKLEKRVQELGGTTAQGSNGAEARVVQSAASSLKDKIGAEADPSVMAHVLSDEDTAGIRKAILKNGGSEDIADHIINGINNARSLQELRSIQRPFVNASELSDAADLATGGALTPPIKQAPGVMDEATNVATNVALGNHYGVAQNAGRAVQKSGILDRIASGVDSASNKVPDGSSTLLNRIIGVSGGVAGRNSVDNGQNDVPQVTEPQSDFGPVSQIAPEQSTEPTIDKGTLLQLIAADPKNATTYISLYNLFNKDTTPSPTQQKSVAAAKTARATLGQIEDAFAAAGGGQGKLGGRVANIGAKIGANSGAATYNDTATSLAASLYKALGNTGTISDKDQEMIAKLIPKTTDTADTAQQKLAQLESLLQEAEQNSMVTQ